MKKGSAREKKTRRPKTPGMIVSRIIICVGLVLMLTVVIYEAANYPWGTLTMSQEDLNSIVLPDPPTPRWNEGATTYTPPPASEEADELADDSLLNVFDGPNLDVVQELVGVLKLPKIGTSVNIYEGAGQSQLILGAGHVIGTPFPDSFGNVCIAGHRVTRAMHPLRHMDMMAEGDMVYVIYGGHEYRYRTLEVFPVYNTEKWVMRPVEGEDHLLTLITCHPPGSARQRLILRGRLVGVDDMTPEEFFSRDAAGLTVTFDE